VPQFEQIGYTGKVSASDFPERDLKAYGWENPTELVKTVALYFGMTFCKDDKLICN
jgi:hypothetical protein